MFNNQISETNANHNAHSDEYDYYNMDNGHRFIVSWSPQEENKYFSKHKFASPRVLSKSVPRRSKSLMRYKINRSLNFDSVHNKNESTIKSSNSTAEKSCFEGGNQLSRSAKIMRALNFGSDPLYNQTKKIKKSLNFDLSPKPRRFTSSPQNVSKLSSLTPSPKLSRSSHFDSSPNDSNSTPSSVLLTSSESIDENQNQTPSQRSRKVKKSLNYLTPALEQNVRSSDMIIMTPLLRSDLKEKIDNIVQIAGTPNLRASKKSIKKIKNRNDVTGSTPRNLFHDFCDEDNERPCTPENTIRIIPESMSAIKKSHKKDRLLRRSDHDISDATSDPFTTELADTLKVEKRPSTPPMTEKNRSPTYDVNSIKQSHKKDKTKRKVAVPQSEDEISDTGSIFEYCTDQEEGVQKNVSVESDKHEDVISLKDSSYGSEENSNHCASTDDCKHKDEALHHESDCVNNTNEISENPPKAPASQEEPEKCIEKLDVNPMRIDAVVNADSRPRTPEVYVTSPGRSQRIQTPENHVNYLQRIMTESIKKSHRKVKDENRKKLFRPKSLHQKLESHRPDFVDDIDQNCPSDGNVGDCRSVDDGVNLASSEVNRAVTPENVNSSRLLLSQFSSVKKSHKKDKHNKIISGFKKRQRYFSKHGKPLASMENKSHDSSMSSCENDRKESDASECGVDTLDRKVASAFSSANNDNNPKSCPYQGTPSPSKRKKLNDSSLWSAASKTSDNLEAMSGEYESAEEEFKIFTPIKKRKPLPTYPEKRSTNAESSEEESMNVATSRCITPVLNYHESFNSSDGDFQPIKNSECEVENDENGPPRPDEDHNSSDANGRQTPQNRSTAELLVHLNSIKKSHKKDKRGSDLRRQLAMNQEASLSIDKENEDFADLSVLLVPSAHSSPNIETHKGKRSQGAASVDYDNPQPSTSKASIEREGANEDVGKCCSETLNVTPPNCLRTMTYIKLIQTESIKRSHKQVRVQKKYSAMVDNSELSDDGSIFGDDEIAVSMEESKLMSSISIPEDGEGQVQNRFDDQIDSAKIGTTASSSSLCNEGQEEIFQSLDSPNQGSPDDAPL